jgi:hypothetical protein
MCGPKERVARGVERVDGFLGMMSRGNLEILGWSKPVVRSSMHQHHSRDGVLPEKDQYHGLVRMEERTVYIV